MTITIFVLILSAIFSSSSSSVFAGRQPERRQNKPTAASQVITAGNHNVVIDPDSGLITLAINDDIQLIGTINEAGDKFVIQEWHINAEGLKTAAQVLKMIDALECSFHDIDREKAVTLLLLHLQTGTKMLLKGGEIALKHLYNALAICAKNADNRLRKGWKTAYTKAVQKYPALKTYLWDGE